MEKELTRETVDPRYTWDLTRIYASDEAWEEAFADVKAQAEAFGKRAGTLSHGREAVLDALTAMMRMDETFFALHAYAMMKNNEDSTNAKYQAMSDRAGTLAGVVAAACSFMEPELLALEEGEIEKMIADPAFAEYDRYLSGVLRMKAHTLTASEEKLMAMASDACNAAATAYEMLSYADMNLGKTRGENGEKPGRVICVGGGIGVAPMHPIAQALKAAGNEVTIIMGARNDSLFVMTDEMRAIAGDRLILMTDDGSSGRKGLVTDPLKELCAAGGIDEVIAIGPPIMMKFCALATQPFGVKTTVSLNTIMIDGTGMCGGCRITVGGETKFVCVDGPEFDAHQVDWDQMLKRMGAFKPQESVAKEHVCNLMKAADAPKA